MDSFDRFLLTVVYDLPSLILVVDPNTKTILYANQQMLSMYGDECIGKPFSQCFPASQGDHYFVTYDHRRLQPKHQSGSFTQQSEYYDDESENWYHVLQREIQWYDQSTKIVIILNEINSLKRLQKELSEAHATLAFKNRELEIAAKTDSLTQLNNRHQLDIAIEHELIRSRRTGHCFAVFMIDCDHFKSVNDTYGHQTGDILLIQLAKIIKESIRATDIPGRWGGEEFLVILPDTNVESAALVADKLRKAIENYIFPVVGRKTVSIGVASLSEEEDVKALIGKADDALYRAKFNGRNRVEVAL